MNPISFSNELSFGKHRALGQINLWNKTTSCTHYFISSSLSTRKFFHLYQALGNNCLWWNINTTMDSLLTFMTGFVIITKSMAVLNVIGGGPMTTFTGESSKLTCSFSPTNSLINSPMSPVFAWSFEGENGDRGQIGTCDVTSCAPEDPTRHRLTISTDSGIGVMTLLISETLLSDAGNYTCLVSTSEDAQSAIVQLNVTECSVHQPSIVCPSIGAIGSFMDIACSYQAQDQTSGHFTRIAKIYLTDSLKIVYANVPNFNISVTINRGSIPNATEELAELKLTSVCCRSASSLTCRAPEGQNLCSDICITDVLYPPTDIVLTQSPHGPWSEGMRDASIICRSNGFPSPTVSWQRVLAEGASSPSIILANGTGSSTLNFLPYVRRQIAGVYRCEADNQMESVARNMTNISVQYRPHLVDPVFTVHANEGTVASLPCKVDANPAPISIITWSSPTNQSLIANRGAIVNTQPSDSVVESRLLFTKAVHRDIFGNYTCTAENALGRVSLIIELTGHCYPDPPSDFFVVTYTGSSLTLSWTPGEDGGLPMTFTISYCANVSEVERCSKEQDITNHQIIINDLRSYTLYGIALFAENDVGGSRKVEISTSTAPRPVEALGISAAYDIISGKLDISSTKNDIGDLCIHAEFHVGGLRKRNETCLHPGQTVYIQNGAKEHQLWLVVCGRDVCSSSSRVTYLDSIDENWSLLFILVVTLGCCFGLTVLILLFIGLYRLTRRRQSWDSTDFDDMSDIHRALPMPPSRAHAIGLVPLSQGKDDAVDVQNYDAIQNIKVQNEALQRTPEGYMQMNAAKTTKATDQGIYTTHLQPGLTGPKEPETTAQYGTNERRSPTTKSDDKVALKLDLHHIEDKNDTYSVAETTNETGSDYMVPTSPRCDFKDTAV